MSSIQQSQFPQVQSWLKLMSLPIVQASMNVVQDSYGRVKGLNSLTQAALERAETTVTLALQVSQPVVAKLEAPIKQVDSIVYTGLSKLEEKAPVIKKSPEEILNEGRTRVSELRRRSSARLVAVRDSVRETTMNKVGVITSYGRSQVDTVLGAPLVSAIMKSVDTAMDLTEQAVEHYLPPVEGEPSMNPADKDKNVVERMGQLSEKMRRRMTYQVTIQLNVLSKRGTDIFGNSRTEITKLLDQVQLLIGQILSRSGLRSIMLLLPIRHVEEEQSSRSQNQRQIRS